VRTAGGRTYRGLVKRVYGAGDPSVNHLVILEEQAGLGQSYSPDTDDDEHDVTVSGAGRLYYLLYAGTGGAYIGDEKVRQIFDAFLGLLHPAWLRSPPAAGILHGGERAAVDVGFDATGLPTSLLESRLVVSSNDPDEPEVEIPVRLAVTAAPDIALGGVEVSIESAQDYITSGALTVHSFPVTMTPHGGGNAHSHRRMGLFW